MEMRKNENSCSGLKKKLKQNTEKNSLEVTVLKKFVMGQTLPFLLSYKAFIVLQMTINYVQDFA